VAALSRAASYHGVTFHVLVEVDLGMKRCGVGSAPEAVELAKRIADAPGLAFEGIQAYAGHISHETDEGKRDTSVSLFEAFLAGVRDALAREGLPPKEISGGSTGETAHRRPGTVYTEHQAGSYLMMDSTYNALGLPFRQALFVAASRVSCAGGRLALDAGVKALSPDQDDPVLDGYPGWPLTLNEEHTKVKLPEGHAWPDGAVPGRFRIVPGHCCATVNLYDWLYLARGDRVVDRVPVTSRGHKG